MALPAQLESLLSDALAAERAKVEADERAAFDGPSRSAALAGRKLYQLHEAKAFRAREGVDVELAAALLNDVRFELRIPSVILPEAARRTVTGAVAEVGGGIARDAADLAVSTGRGWMTLLKASPLVLLGLLVLAVVLVSRKVPAPPAGS